MLADRDTLNTAAVNFRKIRGIVEGKSDDRRLHPGKAVASQPQPKPEKDKLQHQREHAAEDAFESQLLEQLVSGLKAEIPEAMFERRVDESVREFEYRLQSQGLNLDTYLQYTGMDMDAFRKGFREQAEKQVKIRLALEKIAALEEIAPTEEELDAEFAKLAEQYKMDVEKVKAFIPAKELSKDLAVGKAMDMVKETAVVNG